MCVQLCTWNYIILHPRYKLGFIWTTMRHGTVRRCASRQESGRQEARLAADVQNLAISGLRSLGYPAGYQVSKWLVVF